MALKDSYSNTVGTYWPLGDQGADTYVSVKVSVTSSYYLGSLDVPLEKIGAPTMSLYAGIFTHDSVNNAPNVQLGTWSNALAASSVASTTAYTMMTFAGIKSCPVVPGTYWIVLKAGALNASNYVRFGSNNGASTDYQGISSSGASGSWGMHNYRKGVYNLYSSGLILPLADIANIDEIPQIALSTASYNMAIATTGITEMLKAWLNNIWPTGGKNLTLRLYMNNYKPAAGMNATNFSEVTGGGYVSKTLGNGAWIIMPSPPSASLPEQIFLFSGPLTGSASVYGHYITDSVGAVVWAQYQPTFLKPTVSGDHIDLTPIFTAGAGGSGRLVLVNSGVFDMLQAFLNNIWPGATKNLTMKLFTNNIVPTQGMTVMNLIEASGGGYAPVTLTNGNWTVSGTTATYAKQRFTFTSALNGQATIYGYYVVDSAGTLVWIENVGTTFQPFNGGDYYEITPQVTAQ